MNGKAEKGCAVNKATLQEVFLADGARQILGSFIFRGTVCKYALVDRGFDSDNTVKG
jgi:hypothetical protein